MKENFIDKVTGLPRPDLFNAGLIITVGLLGGNGDDGKTREQRKKENAPLIFWSIIFNVVVIGLMIHFLK